MKKVAVIPYSDYEKMSTQPVQQPLPTTLYEPKIEQLSSVEKNLTEILNSSMDIHEKRIKYQEILQKLIDLKERYNTTKPINEVAEFETVKDFKNILETSLPMSVKNKGMALYNTLKGQINWDNDGQIVINGDPIVGSNIIDLISDLVRNWRRNPITGWPIIKQKLRTINFPKSLILNQDRLADLENVFTPSRAVTVGSLDTASGTPLGLMKKRTRKSPYPAAKKLRKKAEVSRQWLKI